MGLMGAIFMQKICWWNFITEPDEQYEYVLDLKEKNRSVWPTLEKTCVIEKFKANVGTTTDQMCW